VFNTAILHRLRSAPPALRGRLPDQVNAVSTALSRPGGPEAAVARYLRQAITAAMHDVYTGLAGVAVVTLAVVLVIIPRRFETTAGASADVPDVPGGPGGPR
jgi:hypothetical protein